VLQDKSWKLVTKSVAALDVVLIGNIRHPTPKAGIRAWGNTEHNQKRPRWSTTAMPWLKLDRATNGSR